MRSGDKSLIQLNSAHSKYHLTREEAPNDTGSETLFHRPFRNRQDQGPISTPCQHPTKLRNFLRAVTRFRWKVKCPGNFSIFLNPM